jgi:hypothetical protein
VKSKNKKAPTVAEREHIEKVKALPCSVCDAPPPTEAHEIKQGQWFTSCALCDSCHRGPLLGLHGQRRMWEIKNMNELAALNVTVRRLAEARAL